MKNIWLLLLLLILQPAESLASSRKRGRDTDKPAGTSRDAGVCPSAGGSGTAAPTSAKCPYCSEQFKKGVKLSDHLAGMANFKCLKEHQKAEKNTAKKARKQAKKDAQARKNVKSKKQKRRIVESDEENSEDEDSAAHLSDLPSESDSDSNHQLPKRRNRRIGRGVPESSDDEPEASTAVAAAGPALAIEPAADGSNQMREEEVAHGRVSRVPSPVEAPASPVAALPGQLMVEEAEPEANAAAAHADACPDAAANQDHASLDAALGLLEANNRGPGDGSPNDDQNDFVYGDDYKGSPATLPDDQAPKAPVASAEKALGAPAASPAAELHGEGEQEAAEPQDTRKYARARKAKTQCINCHTRYTVEAEQEVPLCQTCEKAQKQALSAPASAAGRSRRNAPTAGGASAAGGGGGGGSSAGVMADDSSSSSDEEAEEEAPLPKNTRKYARARKTKAKCILCSNLYTVEAEQEVPLCQTCEKAQQKALSAPASAAGRSRRNASTAGGASAAGGGGGGGSSAGVMADDSSSHEDEDDEDGDYGNDYGARGEEDEEEGSDEQDGSDAEQGLANTEENEDEEEPGTAATNFEEEEIAEAASEAGATSHTLAPSENPLACQYCGKSYNRRSRVVDHEFKEHSTHNCTKCNFKTKFFSALKKHITTQHPKMFQCRYCEQKSKYKKNIQVHERIHTGDKPFACKYCKFQASRKWDLDIHARKHTQENLLACPECDFRTARSNVLANHIRTHTKEKPYGCKFCNYRAAQRGDLISHLKNHSDGHSKRYHCTKMNTDGSNCTYGADTEGAVTSHMTKHHIAEVQRATV